MRIATKVLRAGLGEAAQGEPFSPGVTFAAPYRLSGDPASSAFTYGRLGNPNWSHFENALAQLEGGTVLSFASGMAAITAVFGISLRPGDVLVLPDDCYYTSRLLAEGYFAQMGIQIRKVCSRDDALMRNLDGARLLWLETPSNPSLNVSDIAALTREAHQRGVLVAVDNTTATILGQNPLELGADFSLASDTKALTGHSDLLLGHVAVRDHELAEKLRIWRTQTGAVPGPMEAWLACRSLATAEMRISRQAGNAMRVAEFLSTRSEVSGLRYPGLPQDASYPVASRQMRFFGPIVSFELCDRQSAEHFLSRCRLIIEATSFGGVHSTAERRGRWGGDHVAEGFIRMSVGCEDVQDIIEDMASALAQ